MNLQLLIPQYKETDEIVKPLLDSIALQQRVSPEDFSVIICNDGSDVFLSDELIQSYSYKIEYHKDEHRGVSGTRNALMDYAEADYVMFCDADDMFFNMYGIRFIMDEIGRNQFDMYTSAFFEELLTEDGFTYVEHKEDRTFIHGKVFRLQFLKDGKIRFNEKLQFHEDSCFNAIAENSASECRYCDTAFYMWKWRDDSVCRNDPLYNQKTTDILVDANDYAIEHFMRMENDVLVRSFVTTHLIAMYYELNKPNWSLPESEEYVQIAEKRLSEFYEKYKDVWDSVQYEDRVRISNDMRNKAIDEGMNLEKTSLVEWLAHLEKISEERKHEDNIVDIRSLQACCF